MIKLPLEKRLKRQITTLLNSGLAFLLVLASILTFYSPPALAAAQFTNVMIFTDNIEASQTTKATICVEPATTSSSNHDLQITFPTGSNSPWTVSSSTGDWVAVTSGIPTSVSGSGDISSGTGTTAWPGITTAVPSVSGSTVTWTYGSDQSLSHGQVYCFRTTNAAITLPSATSGNVDVGAVKTRNDSTTTIDSGQFSEAVVSGTNDQISISASVAGRFTFALGANSLGFGTLPTSGTPSGTGTTLTIQTNAPNGWNAWIKSANGGLKSSTTGQTIASSGSYDGTPTNISGAEGYQLNAASGTDSPTVAPEYLSGSTTTTGGFLDTKYQQLAYQLTPTATATVSLNFLAEASTTRAPGSDYDDTLTVVASGSF